MCCGCPEMMHNKQPISAEHLHMTVPYHMNERLITCSRIQYRIAVEKESAKTPSSETVKIPNSVKNSLLFQDHPSYREGISPYFESTTVVHPLVAGPFPYLDCTYPAYPLPFPKTSTKANSQYKGRPGFLLHSLNRCVQPVPCLMNSTQFAKPAR